MAEDSGTCLSVHSLHPENEHRRCQIRSAVFDGHVGANPMGHLLVVGVVRRDHREYSAGFEFWSLSGLVQKALRQRREGQVPRLTVLCARELYAAHLVDWLFKRGRVPLQVQHLLPFTDSGGLRDDSGLV